MPRFAIKRLSGPVFVLVRACIGAALLANLLAVPTPAFAQRDKDAVATMGTQKIDSARLRRIIEVQPPEVRKQLATDLNALDRLVRSELTRQAILTEARQKGWEKRADLQLLMERASEEALITAYVADLARPPREYPSEDEIKAFYDASRENLTSPAEYQLAQIFIASPASADIASVAAAQKKAADLEARVRRSPRDFEKIARESSEHEASADKGGSLGWLPETQLIPEIRAAVIRMTDGEISPPIRSATGWHIVKLVGRKPGNTQPLADVRDRIVANMRLRKAREAERAYFEELLGTSAVSVDEDALRRLQRSIKQ